MSERRRCQLRALLNEAWGKVDGNRPVLKIVLGQAEFEHESRSATPGNSRDHWELQSRGVAVNTVVAIPCKRKRGAKVRTGPCAQIIALPGVFIGEELDERYEFVHKHAEEWRTTDTEGTQAVDWNMRRMHEAVWKVIRKKPLTDHIKRAEIARGRARIETRNRIKAYLEQRGVNLDNIHNAEDALFALFAFVEGSA